MAGGTVLRGTIKESDKLLVGPTDDGSFHPVTISSIHRNRLPVRVVSAGQAASMSFNPPKDCSVRKVTVLMFIIYLTFNDLIFSLPKIKADVITYRLQRVKHLCTCMHSK